MAVATGTPTYYEVECTNGERHIFVGYTSCQHNRPALQNLLLNHFKPGASRLGILCALTNTTDKSWRHWLHAQNGIQSGEWTIRWTGRIVHSWDAPTQLPEQIDLTGEPAS